MVIAAVFAALHVPGTQDEASAKLLVCYTSAGTDHWTIIAGDSCSEFTWNPELNVVCSVLAVSTSPGRLTGFDPVFDGSALLESVVEISTGHIVHVVGPKTGSDGDVKAVKKDGGGNVFVAQLPTADHLLADGFVSINATSGGDTISCPPVLGITSCSDSIAASEIVLDFTVMSSSDPTIVLSREFHYLTVAGLTFVPLGPSAVPPGGFPVSARLYPAAPNPFRSRTTIALDLARPGPVRLQVFDPTGRKVATLADRELPSGHHTMTWDGRNDLGRRVESGIYFLMIKAPGLSESGRVVRLQ